MVIWILTGIIVYLVISIILNNREHRRTVNRLNDTIQRLVNREPVTYKEVGAKPPKPNREVYAAWGNQMVNMDEDVKEDG